MTLTSNDIAERLHIRRALIHEWLAEGVIPRGTKVGRQLHWTEAEFDTIRAHHTKRRAWRSVVQQQRKLRSGKPFTFSNPLVAQLIDILFTESSLAKAAARSGYDGHTIRPWYSGTDPRLSPFIDVANALGYELVLRKKT